MALVAKTAPLGVDAAIDAVQRSLYDYLTGKATDPWSEYESYHRAYKNEKGTGTIPEVYDGDKEYLEVFYDDKFRATSFFLAEDTRTESEPNTYTQSVSMIFQVDLGKLYPSVTHRADEEMHNDIMLALQEAPVSIGDISVLTGLNNVYAELNLSAQVQELIKNDDMQQCHVVRFSFDVLYSPRADCTHVL